MTWIMALYYLFEQEKISLNMDILEKLDALDNETVHVHKKI